MFPVLVFYFLDHLVVEQMTEGAMANIVEQPCQSHRQSGFTSHRYLPSFLLLMVGTIDLLGDSVITMFLDKCGDVLLGEVGSAKTVLEPGVHVAGEDPG